MQKFMVIAVALVIGMTSVAGVAHADLVVNGGFETGDYTGWTRAGGNNAVFPSGIGYFNSQSGNYYDGLGPTGVNGASGTLSQTLSTTTGQAYEFSFYLAVSFSSSNSFLASVGGNTLFSGTDIPYTGTGVEGPGGLYQFPYQEYSYSFTATGPATDLTFVYSNENGYFGLDTISVVNASTAPEPSGFALLGLSVICLAAGYVVRKRILVLA